MDKINILAQVFGIGALLFWLWSIQTKDKKEILKKQGIANVFYAMQYITLGAFSTGSMNLLSTIRNTIFYENERKNKDNSKILLLIFCVITIAIGLINFNGLICLIPIIISLAYTYATWQKSTKTIRWIFTIGAIIWIYYNLKIGAYVSVIGNLFEIISGIVAIARFELENNTKRGVK